MKKLPAVSYILCVFNGEKTLISCLKSLLSQKGVDLEIIAVNDGSTDGSLSILKNFSRKDKRIKIINQANLGLSVARNAGILKATGDYIASAAQDDIYLPFKSIDQIKFMEKNHLDFSFTNVELINRSDKIIRHPDTGLYNSPLWSRPWVIFQALFFMPLCSPSFLCKKICYEKIKWNPGLTLFADYNLWIKMFIKFKGGKLAKVALLHRYSDKLKNASYRKKFPLSFLYMGHRVAAASAVLYNFLPPSFIPPITNFFKVLKNIMILENNPYAEENISAISRIFAKLGFKYVSKKLNLRANYFKEK